MEMKVGNVITKNGIDLIVVPCDNTYPDNTCIGCYFYDEETDDCRYNGITECWDEGTFEDIIFKEVEDNG